jgi:hypothetical protein
VEYTSFLFSLPFYLWLTVCIMPSAPLPDPPTLPPWERPKKTTFDLDWAEISVIDLSTFDAPGGKEKLAEELRHAVSKSECPKHITFT